VLEGKVRELQRDGLTVVEDVLSPEELRGARAALDWTSQDLVETVPAPSIYLFKLLGANAI
jgi:hypothetical protein